MIRNIVPELTNAGKAVRGRGLVGSNALNSFSDAEMMAFRAPGQEYGPVKHSESDRISSSRG